MAGKKADRERFRFLRGMVDLETYRRFEHLVALVYEEERGRRHRGESRAPRYRPPRVIRGWLLRRAVRALFRDYRHYFPSEYRLAPFQRGGERSGSARSAAGTSPVSSQRVKPS